MKWLLSGAHRPDIYLGFEKKSFVITPIARLPPVLCVCVCFYPPRKKGLFSCLCLVLACHSTKPGVWHVFSLREAITLINHSACQPSPSVGIRKANWNSLSLSVCLSLSLCLSRWHRGFSLFCCTFFLLTLQRLVSVQLCVLVVLESANICSHNNSFFSRTAYSWCRI